MLDIESFLDAAEILYLLESKIEFVFPLRKPTGSIGYYEGLERELRSQPFLKIKSFRMVKEGWTKISRPAELSFELDSLFSLRPYLKSLKNRIERLSASTSEIDLIQFLKQNKELLNSIDVVESCIEVLQYLIRHRQSVIGLLPRQIPHGQSTKLIGRENILLRLFSFWRTETLSWKSFFDFFQLLDKPMEFRFFAPQCQIQKKLICQHHGVLAPDWCQDYDFSLLQATLIVENIESFYEVSKKTKNSLILWGAGWKASQISFLLHMVPKTMFYWGDIDKEGYEIFGYMKKLYPPIRPLLMEATTIQKYFHLLQKKEKYDGPLRPLEDLKSEYEMVARGGLQIEQEQLAEPWPLAAELP